MSKITGTNHGEAFELRVVSGMVIDGSLIVTWATGDYASSQINWGYDPTVPNQTNKPLLKPEDRGYNPKKENPKLVRYHRVAFPQTYVDTEHFFRAISVNRVGKKVISRVYSVFVTAKMFNQSFAGTVKIGNIQPVLVAEHPCIQTVGISSIPLADSEPKGRVDNISLDPIDSPMPAPGSSSVDGKSSMETSFTLTLAEE
jgi:hypothetical protein